MSETLMSGCLLRDANIEGTEVTAAQLDTALKAPNKKTIQ
jgi:hypothetical protein